MVPIMQKNYKAAESGGCEEKKRKIDLRFLFLQDNATAHTSQAAMAAAINCSYSVLPHPLFSRFCPFGHLSVSKSEKKFLV